MLGVSNGKFIKSASKFAHFDWTALKFKSYLDGAGKEEVEVDVLTNFEGLQL